MIIMEKAVYVAIPLPRLLFCTVGVLLRKMQANSDALGKVTHVFIDEVHERSTRHIPVRMHMSFTRTYVHLCLYFNMCVQMIMVHKVSTNNCIYMYIYIHICICICIDLHIDIYIYIDISIYIYI